MKKLRGKQPKKDFQRKRPQREAPEVVYILCEAEKTEPNYLNWVKHKNRLSSVTIKSGKTCGKDPKNLVRAGIKLRSESSKIWLVFDCDERGDFKDDLKTADVKKLKVAYSNPCIELWFLLHFEYSTASLKVDEAIKRLQDYIPNYEKNKIDYIDKLDGREETAFENAKMLRNHQNDIGNNESDNPSTTMDKLIQLLISLKHDTTST